MNIEKKLINFNYSSRNGKKIEYIVIHDTGNKNKGADAEVHYRYFSTGNRGASAHYFVDDKKILQIIDDSKAAWHVGDGRGRFGITNQNSIGIEICVNSDGIYEKAVTNAIELTKMLMQKYNIPLERVVRHYDASRKLCPASMLQDNWTKWQKFKINVAMNKSVPVQQNKKGEVIATTLNCREQPSINASINGKLPKGAQVTIYAEQGDWYLVNNKTPQWVCRDYVKIL